MNKKGYIHWLIPVTLLVLITGALASMILDTKFLGVISLLMVGGCCGHIIHIRKKISLFSLHIIILAFVVGFATSQELLRNIWIFILFYGSLALVYYGEDYIGKNK